MSQPESDRLDGLIIQLQTAIDELGRLRAEVQGLRRSEEERDRRVRVVETRLRRLVTPQDALSTIDVPPVVPDAPHLSPVAVGSRAIQQRLPDLARADDAGATPIVTSAPPLRPESEGDASASAASDRHASSRRRPVRDLVLDILQDLGSPAYSRQVSHVAEALFGRPVPAQRFGTLAKDEIQAYQVKDRPNARNRPRPVWLCFGLTHDHHEPIKRLLCRSDWPLVERIVASTTGRILHARVTARLCALALQADETAADPAMLRIIAADHAGDLPGVVARRGQFDLELWRDVALEEIVRLGPEDEQARKLSAERLVQRPEFYQLFGLPDVIEGEEPSRETWRDRA